MIFLASLSPMSFFSYLLTYNLLPEYPLTLPQLQQATRQLDAHYAHSFRNHAQRASTFIKFCNYHFPFIMPSMSTICCYITHLTHHFKLSASIRNYISGVRILHKELGLIPESLNSFPVVSQLRAADITMRTPPLRWLPIFPVVLDQSCLLSSSLGALAPPCGCA